jgi:small redox-active disulfide protein 2
VERPCTELTVYSTPSPIGSTPSFIIIDARRRTMFDFLKKHDSHDDTHRSPQQNDTAQDASPCCRSGSAGVAGAADDAREAPGARIEIFGSGCARCKALEAHVRGAATELGSDAPIGHITDFSRIAAYGVLSTPALAIDGKVVSSGRVLTVTEAVDVLRSCGW